MQILPKFNLIQSENLQKKQAQRYSFIKQNEQKDSFTSTTGQVAFKAKAPIPPSLERMLKSKNYWALLGAAVTAVAANLWQQLTNNGENDIELTEAQIAELIKANYPDEIKEQENTLEDNENVIDVEPVEVSVVTEANDTEASEPVEVIVNVDSVEDIENQSNNNENEQKLKLKTIKLDPAKQSAEPIMTEKDLEMLERIKELQAQDYKVKDMSKELGVSTTKIYLLMKAGGVNPPHKQKLIDAKKLTKEEVIKLCEDNIGVNTSGLSYILGISIREMENILRKYDIPAPRRITNTKKLEALKKAKEEEKAKEAANKTPEEKTVENVQDIKPEVAKNAQEKIEEQINEETAVKNDAELNKTVLELSRQKLSHKQIADRLGLTVGEVRKIFIDEIKNSVNKLQELADKGYTLEQAAEELGKDIKIIERDAKRKGIVFNTNTEDSETPKKAETADNVETAKATKNDNKTTVKTDNELEETKKEIDLKKYSEIIKKFKETIKTDIQFASSTLILNEAIEEDINKIREEHKDKIDLINKLERANFFSGVADYKKIDPTLAEITPQGYIRYSAKDLLMRSLADQYSVIANDKNLEARFTMAKNRGLKTISPTDLNKIILSSDTNIPENDPMFEKFVECFDFESCLKQIEIAIKKHNNAFIKEACPQELVDKINELNGPYIKIDKNVLFNIICKPEVAKGMMFYYSIPKFQNADDVTQTQKELMQAIEEFKYRSSAKEYIDLVNIYNTYCGENCDEEFTTSLLKELKAIEKPQEFNQETIDELRSIIKSYSTGVVPERMTPDNSELYDVKTINIDENTTKEEKEKFLQESKNILNECFDDERYNNEDLLSTIIDFMDFVNIESLDDLQNLQKLIIILDDIKNNKITIKKANDICKTENIKTTAKIKEEELEEEIKKEDELRTNLNKQYLRPFFNKFNNNTLISNILAAVQYKLSNLDLNKLESLEEVLNMFQQAIDIDSKQDINKILEIIKTQFFTSDEIEKLDQLIADKNKENNIKYLKGEIKLEDNYKKIVKEKFDQGNITEAQAMDYLKIIDSYQNATFIDKSKITNILEFFKPNEKSKIGKKVLEEFENDENAKKILESFTTDSIGKKIIVSIIEEEYLNETTFINNDFLKKTIKITPAVKNAVWGKYKSENIMILIKSENVAKNKSITRGGNGDEGFEIRKSDDNPIWLKICGNLGDIRLTGIEETKDTYTLKNLKTNSH